MTGRGGGFELLDIAGAHGCEAVHLAADPATGMRAVVAVHSTVLGPGLGGTRFQAYPDEAMAVLDVCRLARGMTYKHAACGNDQGGGKAVLIGDPATMRTEALIEAYARFVDRLGGVYLTAEDVGTTQADMDLIRRVTPYVTGTSLELGGSGDPSPATAWGVRWAMAAVAERLWGAPSLAGRHVVVLGVGKVGSALARHLRDEGARLTLSDVRPDVVGALAAELGADVVEVADAVEVDCDVLSPCALGALLDERSIPRLGCAAVCGAANNQLATDDDGARLAEAGILYAPDYVVNAGGVVNIAEEQAPGGYDPDRARARVERIGDTVRRVFALADGHGIVPAAAADRLAEDRLAAAQAGQGR
ncbi:MAG: Glu/Leu/Phe/Val dehydrogenase [Acidimicrobiia bacterium]|nr:Glu/Leu/Phe/Val dehydrogenase [Acidimicrobiia bacterium]